MPVSPLCNFYLYNKDTPVLPEDTLWNEPVPQNRPDFTGLKEANTSPAVSLGMYFDAVDAFLASNGYEPLLKSLSSIINRPVKVNHINTIDVVLEKHGAYYHPSCIEVDIQAERIALVLNVALAATGQEVLLREYSILQHMNTTYPWTFLPQVYARGNIPLSRTQEASMFLGQWFEGFHEFHWTRHPDSGVLGLVVWDPATGSRYLTNAQAESIFQQAATILTAYFNPITFEQIFAWHHAAGDFIVNVDQDPPEVKLITVRQYTPLFENVEPDPETIIQSLQVFLFNLSIRMRLDRLDGVGDMTWAPDLSVKATVQGFFKGLNLQLTAHDLPQELADLFCTYIKSQSKSAIIAGLIDVVSTYDPGMPGLDLVNDHLKSHAASLSDVLDQF